MYTKLATQPHFVTRTFKYNFLKIKGFVTYNSVRSVKIDSWHEYFKIPTNVSKALVYFKLVCILQSAAYLKVWRIELCGLSSDLFCHCLFLCIFVCFCICIRVCICIFVCVCCYFVFWLVRLCLLITVTAPPPAASVRAR